MFSGIWLPIVTPLRNGEVDIDAQQRLADYYLRTEIGGFVALSTTGEAALLQEAERLTILQPLTEVVGSRLPMLIGVGGSATRTRIELVLTVASSAVAAVNPKPHSNRLARPVFAHRLFRFPHSAASTPLAFRTASAPG